MKRSALIAGLLGLLSLAVPAASQQNLLPQLSLDAAGACRQLSVRDRDSNAMVPMGCLSGGKWRLPPNGLAPLPEGETTLGGAFASRQKVFRYDPRVYGATCNGSGAGDDNGIASVLSAIQAIGGGALLIPGKCVISQPKTVTGVPVAVVGDGLAVSQLIGSASFPAGNKFLLRIDIMNGSDGTVSVNGVSFRTLQAEVASGLEIEAIQSNLEERVQISHTEFRGVDPGAHGFAYGIRLRNVNTPKVSNVTITGRQSGGGGPAALTNMDACFDIVNTLPGMTNYVFSDTRCNAAKRAYSVAGYMEGLYCGRCINVAVGYGWYMRPGQQTPLVNIFSSHTDFFNAAVDIADFTQGAYYGNLFYHRADSTANGVCYQMLRVKESQILGGECVNYADTTSLVGVQWSASNDNIVGDMILSKVNTGIVNLNGSAGNVYRRGRWINVPSGAGEHGNGGDNSNVCIGYNAAC